MSPRTNITNEIERLSEVLTLGFQHIAFTAYVLRSADSTWPASAIPVDILGPRMVEWTRYKQSLGAELVESGNFAAAAIWFPPGVELPPSPDDDPRIVEYRDISKHYKKQFLKDRKHWYLNIIARHPERSDPGVVRALFEPYIARAREQGVPLYLEAVSEHSRKVYEHIGFHTLATFRVAVGRASADGEFKEGGEGIVMYAMMME